MVTVSCVEASGTSTSTADRGEVLYVDSCSACHGQAGDGSPLGPPLTDARYLLDAMPDARFVAAVELGVAEGDWGLGPMPAQSGMSHSDIAAITAYVRRLQAG